MMRRVPWVLLALVGALWSGCSEDSDKKKVVYKEATGGAGGSGGSASGSGGTSGSAGEEGSGNSGGTTSTTGGAGEAGTGGSTASGGSGGSSASGGSGGTGNLDSGGAAGEVGTGGNSTSTTGTTVDLTQCDSVSDACCEGNLCGPNLSCAGENCSCVDQVANSMVIRADGRLLRVDPSNQSAVLSIVTGEALTEVTSAFLGHYHGCASRQDGSAWCWPITTDGNNSGNLANGTIGGTASLYQASQVQIDPAPDAGPVYLENVLSVQTASFGGYIQLNSCALTTDGAIYCWGSSGAGLLQGSGNSPYALPILRGADDPIDDAVQVATGRRHACYLNEEGNVYCWGINVGGPLGNGTQTASDFPVRVGPELAPLSDIAKIAVGPDYTCALVGSGDQAGRVYCWGGSNSGVLGIGPPADNTDGCINFCKLLPARVREDAATYLEDVVDIVGGYQSICALKQDGSVWCTGVIGGVYASQLTPLNGVPLTGVASITLHSDDLRAFTPEGELGLVPEGSTLRTLQPNCALLD